MIGAGPAATPGTTAGPAADGPRGRPRRAWAWAAARLAAAGLALALLSGVVPYTRPEVQEWDCPPAPASCARPVRVRGWPLAWASDDHGVSPVGRVDLVGALLGVDRLHAGALALDAALGAALGAALWRAAAMAVRAARRPRPRRGG